MKAILTRLETGDEGTFGEIEVNDTLRVYKWKTGELPWRDNLANRSCILPDDYTALWLLSPKHGNCFHLRGVKGHTDVEMHAANLMGDVAKDFVSQMLGCIALGRAIQVFPAGKAPAGAKSQRGVTESKTAMAEFERIVGREPLELTIRWAPGIGPDAAA